MIRKLSYLLLSITIFLSCKNSNVDKKNSLIIEDNKLKEINNIFDFIEDVNLYEIKKANEEYVLPNIRKLISKNNKYFYSSDINNGSFFISDNIGNILSSFNKKGFGPDEYTELTTFDTKSDSIYIYDFQKQNIKIYNHKGKFLKSHKIAYYFRDFIKTNYGYLIFTAKHSNKVNEEVLNFDLLFIDEEGKVLKKFFPFNPDLYSTVRLHKSSPFFKDYNDIYFNDLMTDSIFKINTDLTKQLKYTFFYKTKTLSKKQISQPQNILISDLMKMGSSFEKTYYFANLKAISDKNILYSYKKGASSIFASLNKENNSKKIYTFNQDKTENELILSPFFIENDYLVSLIKPYNLKFLKNQYLNYNGTNSIFLKKMNKLINKMEEDGNQIIMKYKLKK
jgi:hypothetical protein